MWLYIGNQEGGNNANHQTKESIMKTFNRSFKIGTKVMLTGEYGYREIVEINDTRVNIKVKGLGGSFQRGHVIKFTNRENVEMYPAAEDLFITDQYGSVYERGSSENVFVGKLNGRSLKVFVSDMKRQI